MNRYMTFKRVICMTANQVKQTSQLGAANALQDSIGVRLEIEDPRAHDRRDAPPPATTTFSMRHRAA
jgi:hypothetical protein